MGDPTYVILLENFRRKYLRCKTENGLLNHQKVRNYDWKKMRVKMAFYKQTSASWYQSKVNQVLNSLLIIGRNTFFPFR